MPAGFKQSEHFIAAINKHKGPSKANKYQLTGPYGVIVNGIANNLGFDMRDFKFMCDAANLPGRNLATTEFRTGSVSKSYVHSNNFNPTITLSFILTDDMFIKKVFDRWMDDIIGLTDAKLQGAVVQNLTNYPDEYCGSFGIKKLATNLSSSPASASHIDTYHVEIMEAFPKQINPITLTYGSQDIVKLQVVMAYSRWRIIRGY
jgi:hypothetical protein|tara:strand:- start:878 stop:1489 length:612 start_codon:yes stop_codon:yes gene_type:complete